MQLLRKRPLVILLALGLVGSGLGLCCWRVPAIEAAAPAPRNKPDPPADPKKQDDTLDEMLSRKVAFSGFDDPKTTLAEALDNLHDRFKVAFEINDKAFQAEAIQDVDKQPIAEGRPVPPMANASVARVLRTILARIPSNSGATFVVRDEVVEITTTAALRAELGRTEEENTTPLLPLVRATFDKVPLEDALKQMARKTGFNILIDARAAEKARVPVSAALTNVPLDTAVRLLADMGGLRPVLMDNVLYVTARDNAVRIEQEQAERKAGVPLGGLGGLGGLQLVPATPAPKNPSEPAKK